MNFKSKLYITIIIITSILFGFVLYENHFETIPLWNLLFFLLLLTFTNNISIFFNPHDKLTSIVFPILLPVIILYGPYWTALIMMIGTIELKSREGFI